MDLCRWQWRTARWMLLMVGSGVGMTINMFILDIPKLMMLGLFVGIALTAATYELFFIKAR
jgi:hypothetical protein